MAKFNEYTQKATPEDADTLMIYDAAAKANKLSPFSGIWNWIVGKLTNAVISNLQTSNQTVIGAINELGGNSHLGTLNDNIAEYLRKTKKVATAYFVWGNIGGLYPSWAWGTLLCSNDNTANFIGIANSNKTAAFAHYENGAWEKVPVESLSNLTTTNKSSLVGAINELNSNLTKLSEIKVSSTSYDVPQRTDQTFTPMELSAGTWLIIGHCSSNAPNAGAYSFGINSRMVRANNQNGGGCINAMLIVFDKETSVRLRLYQDATTTLKMDVYLQAIRLG